MDRIKTTYKKYLLEFKFEAGTSRGKLTSKETWFIKLRSLHAEGIGECGPLKGLSIDDRPDFETHLSNICTALEKERLPTTIVECLDLAERVTPPEFPSIRFGIETALLDLYHNEEKLIFKNDFTLNKKPIPINGLIWMGSKAFMLEQIDQKLNQGYNCLKLKIGSLNFEEECEVLKYVRDKFSLNLLTLRVDANGAFSFAEAEKKLKRLKQFDIHSIEQPLPPGMVEQTKYLVQQEIIPVALDEELIGKHRIIDKSKLIDQVKPQFIILKPTLLGGIRACQEWINIAEERNIGWWITSALESNIGLNAIAQFTAEYNITIPQGLGTGQLYWNNISSPLQVQDGFLIYTQNKWENPF